MIIPGFTWPAEGELTILDGPDGPDYIYADVEPSEEGDDDDDG